MTREERGTRRRRWLCGLALLLGLSVVYGATATRDDSASVDTWTAALSAWRIATTGDPAVTAQDVAPIRADMRWVWLSEDARGETVVARAAGPVVAALPAYWLVRPATMTAWPAALTAAALTALAMLLLWGSLSGLMRLRDATLAVVAVALTTPVWSVAADAMWPHTVTLVGVAGMAWAARRERWWLVGLFGGVALWGRLHAAVIVAVLGVALALRRREPGVAVAAGLPAIGALGALCVWNRWVFDSWSPTAAYEVPRFAEYAGHHLLDPVNQLGFLLAPDRGLLVWTPALVLLAPALVRSWRTIPDPFRWLLLGGVAYTLTQTLLNRFSGGDAFYGYRIGLELLVCSAPALAVSARDAGRWARRLLGPVLACQAVAIGVGAVVPGLYLEHARIWTSNAFAVVVAHQPLVLAVVLLLAVGIAELVRRMWFASARPPEVSPGRLVHRREDPLLVERD